MTNEVGENFILYEMAQKIWTAAQETYFDTEDAAEAFKIEGILHDFCQDLTVTHYFSRLKRYWQQLDMYETTAWEYQTVSGKYKKIVEKKGFLNKNLDEARGQILAIKPLPNLCEVAS